LACEIEARPEAPTIVDLVPRVLAVSRTPGLIAVEFQGDALADVEAFAAAERVCCAGIGWEVLNGPDVTLRISADEAALDVLESMWQTIHIEEVQ
jgi:hypothetical protein